MATINNGKREPETVVVMSNIPVETLNAFHGAILDYFSWQAKQQSLCKENNPFAIIEKVLSETLVDCSSSSSSSRTDESNENNVLLEAFLSREKEAAQRDRIEALQKQEKRLQLKIKRATDKLHTATKALTTKKKRGRSVVAMAKETDEFNKALLREEKQGDILGPTWESRYQELVHFQAGHGHCRVQMRNVGLGYWVQYIRRKYKSVDDPLTMLSGNGVNDLNPERIAALNALGFEWRVSPQMTSWDDRYNQLAEFSRANGHVRPSRTKKDEAPLGEWCKIQRRKYKAGQLSPEQVQKLRAILFEFETDDPRGQPKGFDVRLQQCRDFRREHGHCDIPKAASVQEEQETAEAMRFFRWADRTRLDYKRYKAGYQTNQALTKGIIRQLDALGFVWPSEQEIKTYKPTLRPREGVSWETRYQQACAFRSEHGHLVVPLVDRTKRLGEWLKTQRKSYRSKKLDPGRIQLLQEIEIDFDPYSDRKDHTANKKRKIQEVESESTDDGELQVEFHGETTAYTDTYQPPYQL
jgi:hypothetical protein